MFYGWRVVAGGFVTQCFVAGFFTYAVSLLTEPVQAEFGVSVEQVMYSLTAGTFIGLVVMPVVGAMMDRTSTRVLASSGIVVFAICLWALANTSSITQYIIVFGLMMSLVNSLSGSMIAAAVVSRWFTASRGKALGVSAMGTSAGGVLVPALLVWWLPDYGWRGALENLALLLVLVALPLMIWTFRSWPSDLGLDAEPAADSTAPINTQVLNTQQILRNREFWCISLSLGLLSASYMAVLSNMTPYATAAGFSKETGSGLIMTIAVAGLVGKLAFGMAADRLSHRVAFWIAHALVISGFMVLSLQPGYALAFLAATSIGFAAGGMLPVWGALVADVFGLASYGRAMGLMGPILTLCVMPAFPVAGRLYDLYGDYTVCLWVFSAVVVGASLLLLPLRVGRPVVESAAASS